MNRIAFALLAISCILVGGVTAIKAVDNQKKVNKLNLLLPELYEDLEIRAPQFLLEASNGCYTWSSSRPDFLQINGISDEINPVCESTALVKLNNIRPYDNIIWISVTDKDTGDVMRVESKIAKVQKIEILTKLRTIDVGDLSVLEIIGYDKEGNSFSSLEGLRFEWSIQQEENIFEFITFKESKINTSPLRKKLEGYHFQTDIIVIKALQTGKADITVKIKELGQTLVSLPVTLYAIDKFDIYPGNDLYLLPQTILQYELYFTKKATDNKIKLPSNDYNWRILDGEIGQIHQNGQLLTFEKKRDVPTKVIVKPSKQVDYQVTSTVTVVYPHSLEIFSREYTADSWESARRGYYQEIFEKSTYFVRNREYYLRVVLYDANKNEIKITPNVRIDVIIDKTKFDVIEQRNHELRVRPKVLTNSTTVAAQLIEVKGKTQNSETIWKPEKEIKNKVNISIVMPLKLFKPGNFIHLPLHSEQIFKLKVVGGSGQYEWDTSNTTIAVTSYNRVHPKSIGSAKLHVSDKMNEKNFDEIEVIVSNILRAAPLEQMKEVLINGFESTFAIAYPELGSQRFSNCSALAFSVEENAFYSSSAERFQTYEEILKDLNKLMADNVFIKQELKKNELKSFNEEFKEYIQSRSVTQEEIDNVHYEYNNYGYCSAFRILAKEAGEYRARIYAEGLQLQENVDQYISVKVLLPFKNIINPKYFNFFKKDEVIISMGSSYNWRFKHGPSQWESWRKINVNTQVNLKQKGCTGQEGLISNIPKQTTQGNITQSYQLSCGLCKADKENSYTISISAQNEADVKLPRPLVLHNELIVWCNVPHALYIYPLTSPNQRDGDDESVLLQHAKTSKFNKYHLQTEMNHFFFTQVFDSRSLPFANYTSLAIGWKITTSECGPLTNLHLSEYKDQFKLSLNTEQIPQKKDEFRKYELNTCVNFANQQSTDVIKIQATSITLEDTQASPVNFSVNDEILIAVSKNVECDPVESLLYNHKENKYVMNLMYGSGQYIINNNATDVVQHKYHDSQSKLAFVTFKNGVSSLRIEDSLQIGAKKIECRVQVRDPARIDLRLIQDIIPVGAYTQAVVEVYDDQGRKYTNSQVALMDIYLESDTSDNEGITLAIKRDPLNGHKFSIDGKKRGNYRLVAVLKSGSASTYNDPRYANFFIIKSNSLDLEVFPPLEAYPPKIILHPNCQTSLQLIGGPSDSTRVRYSSETLNHQSSQKLIDLNQLDTKLYDIRALEKARGNSTLEFFIHLQPNNTLLSRITVPVTVQNIDDVKIFGMNDRTLHQSTTVRLIAQMFIQGELMTVGICPLSISWQSKLEGVLRISQNISPEILSAADIESSNKNQVSIGDSHLYAVNATAVDVGVAEIELTVTFIGQKSHVRTVARIDVINPLSIPIPTYVAYSDIKPSILLIPPKSGYFMPIQNPLKYTFVTACGQSDQYETVRVDQNGHITTGDKKGVSTHIRAVSNSLQQEIMSVHVYTTSIYSLFVENSHEVINMQVEGETTLQVRMQDFLGRSFPTRLDNVHLRVKVTNTKVLSATISDGSLLNLRAISAGHSICIVYLEANPHIYDIFFVNVGSIVSPSSPVFIHIGGSVQFSVLQAKSSGDRFSSKRWSSSNENVLTIDSNRGLAKANQPGEVLVQYNDVVVYKSKVIVQEVGEIVRGDIGKNNRLTNEPSHPDYATRYVIPFQIFLKDRSGGKDLLKRLENSIDKNPINNNLSWSCKAEHPEWFQVQGEVIDLPNGNQQAQCIVKLVEPNNYQTMNMPPSLILITTITSRNQDAKFSFVQEHKFNDVIWKIHLSNNEKYIELNRAMNKQEIYIQTTFPLDISFGGNDIKPHVISKFFEQKSVQKIEIQISPEFSQNIDNKIYVKHPLTGQTESIRVIYDPESSTPPTPGDSSPLTWTDYLITIILICVTVIVVQNLSKNK
ncbi:hypothetical protein ABPG72_007811 [Tetrahymena utriculariae]